MYYIYIEFRTEGQALKRVDDQIVASDSKGFLYAKFDIDAGWDGLALEAVFEQNGNKYVQVLDEGLCPVPVEVLNAGRFKVWLTGVDSNTVTRATTSSLTIDVLRGPGDDAVNASDPTPTEREQILTIASDAQRIAQSVRNDADEGKFDGEDGKSAYQIAVDNGFEGTEEEWLESLGGVDENAVNEIIEKYLEDNEITGEVDPEEIKKVVEDYLAENPPEAGVDAAEVQKIIEDYLAKNPPVVVETDPTVPAWAKQETKPAYTAEEVGADAEGTAASKVDAHNKSTTNHTDIRRGLKDLSESLADHYTDAATHNDIRLLITELTNRLNALADSTDVDLDQLSELVAYIKANKTLIDAITTNKVSVTDIVNNLTTNVSNKPLSAAQGVALKALIDAITVPTKLSDLTGDSSHRTVTDAEKSAWNDKSNFSGAYADLTGKPTIPTVPTNVSAFNNDAKYVTEGKATAEINTALSQAKASGEFDGADGHTPVKGVDYYTPGEKTELIQTILAELGAGVIGYVDGYNNIVLKGNLAYGDYSVRYEMEDGPTVEIGDLILAEDEVYYSVIKNLTNCKINNSASQVTPNESYTAIISANSGYILSSVTVTMGDEDITGTAYSDGNVTINSVTGNIVITASAIKEAAKTYSITNNLTNCTNSNSITVVEEGSAYSAIITANEGYKLDSVSATMGGSAVTVTDGVINITSVTGDIVITAVASADIINWITNSQNADGSLFVAETGEKGYKPNTRLGTSDGGERTQAGVECTGFIPVVYTDTLYFKGVTITTSTNETAVAYDSNHEKITGVSTYTYFGTMSGEVKEIKLTGINAEPFKTTSNRDKVAYIRISASEINSNSIITKNQPIE